MIAHPAPMPHDHHDHPHALLPPDPALRVKALETILIRKGLIDPAALDEIIDTYQNKIGPQNGARVVAKAWSDPAFRRALLDDATPVVADLGYFGRQGEHMVVVENTPEQHNMVVCTLCSCYPWPLLGIPPGWYKSDAYRARAVREPRKVLAEFGVTLPKQTAVHVWDSTAEVRYLVLPMRPEGTDGLDEEALADLLVETGVLSEADLEGQDLQSQASDTPHPLANRVLKPEAVAGALAKGGPADRPSDVPVHFKTGQAVVTAHPAGNRLIDGGHTRLPAYAAGARGRILRLHGTHVLPDSAAHGLGEAPEPLYAVVFPASELWSTAEHPDDEVVLDLWQSYLAPA